MFFSPGTTCNLMYYFVNPVRTIQFNRSGASPDVNQEEMVTSFLQTNSLSSDVGFRYGRNTHIVTVCCHLKSDLDMLGVHMLLEYFIILFKCSLLCYMQIQENSVNHSRTFSCCFRDGGLLDQVLEKQADMIRYLRQHNEHLSRKIIALSEENDALRKSKS